MKEEQEEDKFEKFYNFIKLDRYKALFFGIFFLISTSFWIVNQDCKEIFCVNFFWGIVYYLFFPCDIITLLLINNLPIDRITILIYRMIYWLLQMIYWYLLSCLTSFPIKKYFKMVKEKKSRNKEDENKKMKESIEKDIRRAEDLEKKKKLKLLEFIY